MLFKTNYHYNDFHKSGHILLGSIIFVLYKLSGKHNLYEKLLKLLIILILFYQGIQLFFNVRFFLDILKIKLGNSIKHTLNKLFDYCVGYILMFVIFKIYTRFDDIEVRYNKNK